MKKILRTIGSLRITVLVVLAIAAISVYGTFLRLDEAMSTVYRSPFFVGLLILFGINLLACTLLRLKFKLLQTGFLATHIGVLVILAGAITGRLGGMNGSLNIGTGETADACYERQNINPRDGITQLMKHVSAVNGEMVSSTGRAVTVKVPRGSVHNLLPALGSSMPYEIIEANAETATLRFAPGVKINKKPLPFSIRLDKFSVEHYNHGDLHITDRSKNLLKTIPAAEGVNIVIEGFTLKVGKFLPNFVLDTETHSATTRDQMPRNPALGVSVQKGGNDKVENLWIFSMYPGMYENMRRGGEKLPFLVFFEFRDRVKSYISEITLLDSKGDEVKKASLKVNHPLSYKNYTIYQSSYDRMAMSYSGLQIVKDPGLWITYTGFALLVAGVCFIGYAKPYIRRKKSVVEPETAAPEGSIPATP